jgi:hypothetical protein
LALGRRQLRPAAVGKLSDEKVRRNHEERIDELQKVEIVRGRLFRGIELPDQTNVPLHHGLGRIAVVIPGLPYATGGSVSAGSIRDRTRAVDTVDPRNYAVLFAEGFGVTMYVDVWVF